MRKAPKDTRVIVGMSGGVDSVSYTPPWQRPA